jgi:hypothetical protein
MIWHPLLVAIVALHLLGLALLAGASVTGVRLLIGWNPGSASVAQLRLERSSETASLLGRASLMLFLCAALALVAAVAGALPILVPGAMCGTGVLQAMGGEGGKAFALQFAALLVMAVWSALDKLDRARPDAPLATACARMILLSLSAQGAASMEVLDAIFSLDPHRPVDCCSIIYGRSVAPQTGTPWFDGTLVLVLAGTLGSVILLLAPLVRRRPGATAAYSLSATALAFVPTAALALVRVLAAYHYQVLSHRCPWCLFLPEHGFAGYPLFGALALVAFEATAMATAQGVAQSLPALEGAARHRVRLAALRITLATTAFVLIATWPALTWRLRFGLWM